MMVRKIEKVESGDALLALLLSLVRPSSSRARKKKKSREDIARSCALSSSAGSSLSAATGMAPVTHLS